MLISFGLEDIHDWECLNEMYFYSEGSGDDTIVFLLAVNIAFYISSSNLSVSSMRRTKTLEFKILRSSKIFFMFLKEMF